MVRIPVFHLPFRRLLTRLRRSAGSLRVQLMFWNVVTLSLLLGGLGILCRWVTLSVMMESVDQELDRDVRMFLRPPPFHRGHDYPGPPISGEDAHGRGGRPGPGPITSGNHFGGDHFGPGGGPGGPHGPDSDNPYRPRHFGPDGRPEMPEQKLAAWDSPALARALRGETVRTTVMVDGEPVRVLSSPGFDFLRRRGAVQAAYPLKDVYRALAGIDSALLLLLPVGLLSAGWMGSALTGRVLKRVHRMTQAAGRIGAADLSRRLPVTGNDEFSEMAGTFNGLLGRLDLAFQEQKRLLQLQQRFTADASHELKTPLTILKGRAGLALSRASTDEKSRAAFQEIDHAADMMVKLVQDLLLLARSDEGEMGRDSIDLLIEELLSSALKQSLQEGMAPIMLDVKPEGLCVVGNEGKIVRLFRNLLDNAVRYTPAEGSVVVTARGKDQKVVVTVKDTGSGIAAEHLPHLGERFHRVDASRTRPTGGTGLGLSICRSIVEAHHGTLTFESALGVGTTVTVTLPACANG